MAFSKKDLDAFMQNELRPGDTFQFQCKMCGNCCRSRNEPILINGADIFRIARALGVTPAEVVAEKTGGYIGDTSHIPVIVLKERLDGSCSLLRNGRCTVQRDKPAVCALYPLGRYYNTSDDSFHYFLNPETCQKDNSAGKSWTLQEWLDEFGIPETEAMTKAWNRLAMGLTMATQKIDKAKIEGKLLTILMAALYLNYDISRPYIPQVERHMVMVKDALEYKFRINVSFD